MSTAELQLIKDVNDAGERERERERMGRGGGESSYLLCATLQ